MLFTIIGYALFGDGQATLGLVGSVLGILPSVTTLPFGLDKPMVDFFNMVYAFTGVFHYIIPWMVAITTVLGVYVIKMFIKTILGSHSPV